MAQIIENWAGVSGKVSVIRDHPTMAGYKQISLRLEKSCALEGFPNLAQADEGSDIWINVRAEALEDSGAREGEPFAAEVRKAFGQVYFLR